MGKAKRKTRLADYDFKMTESNLCKTGGKEKESFRVFFSDGKVHHLVLKDKILGPPIEIPGYFPLPFDSGVPGSPGGLLNIVPLFESLNAVVLN